MIRALLSDIVPRPSLQNFVRKHQVIRFVFNREMNPPPKFHTPRPELCVTFYVKDLQRFSLIKDPNIIDYPRCVINGMYTQPIYRHGDMIFWPYSNQLQ
jgi:hypothetical protein